MAVRVFHGTCETSASENIKTVIITDSDITENNSFQFEEGDLLSVYFLYGNSAVDPRILISNGDAGGAQSEEGSSDVSQTNDGGNFIKTKNNVFIEVYPPENGNKFYPGLWEAGETVLFCYTTVGKETSANYWEAVDAGRATEEIWGITRLEGNKDDSIIDWIDGEDSNDWTTALTPGMLKKFYKALTEGEEKQEEGQESPTTQLLPVVELDWTPNEELSDPTVTLGKLKLKGRSDEEAISIDAPLKAAVLPIVEEILNKGGQEEGPLIPTKTSDLINDGPDPEKENSEGIGHFYITNLLDSVPLYYTPAPSTEEPAAPVEFLIPPSVDNSFVVIKPGLKVDGPLYGENGVTITGTTSINKDSGGNGGNLEVANQISAAGKIQGKTIYSTDSIYEFQTPLNKRYNPQILVDTKRMNNIQIAAGNHCGHKYLNVKKDGYTPLCMVGFNLNYAHSNSQGDATWCFLWECCVTPSKNELLFSIRNTAKRTVYVNAVFYILYQKKL